MTRARGRALLLIATGLTAIGALAFAARDGPPQPLPSRSDKPALMLLTSLPLVFGEEFSLEDGGSPALTALERRYLVVPISTTATPELRHGGLLLLAQPQAQPPENLVALDRWVRDGGRVLLLVDPQLEWPSKRPIGDRLRPPATFLDTGLLRYWGLRLDAPEERGTATRKLGGREVVTASPGSLHGACKISSERLVADCAIGKGRALIVADADLIDGERRSEAADRNFEAVLAALAELEAP